MKFMNMILLSGIAQAVNDGTFLIHPDSGFLAAENPIFQSNYCLHISFDLWRLAENFFQVAIYGRACKFVIKNILTFLELIAA